MARIAGLCGPSFGSWAWTITSQLTGRQPARRDPVDDLGQQPGAVEPLPFRVGVGIVLADVAQAGGAEQGVGHRVQTTSASECPSQPARVVDPDAPQDQRTPLDQPMRVVPDPHPHRASPLLGLARATDLDRAGRSRS